ncbi:MAG: hypothetical protein GY851_01165, partial [bacterium]|nr:hypothetical protein [bacterium]
MPFEGDAERSFPKPHRHEPGHLRQDILDELADHLALATEREREGCSDEATVWQRVLNRFGDPTGVARRLWWDAMKEQVMRDWIQTGVVVVVGLAVVVLVALVATTFGGISRTNEAILAALQNSSGDDENMLTATIVMHRGTPDGPPAEGVVVTFSGKFFGTDEVTLDETTDGAGRVSFGPVLHGKYHLFLKDPQSGMTQNRPVVLFGGKDEEVIHVVAPDVEQTDLRLRSPLPAYIDDEFLLFKVKLAAQ